MVGVYQSKQVKEIRRQRQKYVRLAQVRSTLVTPPPTPHASHHHRFRAHCSGSSGSAPVPRRRWDLLGYCLLSLSDSMRSSIPGGLNSLAMSCVALLPTGVQMPSAHSKAVISGLKPSRSALSVIIAPRLLSCLRIKRTVTSAAGRSARCPTSRNWRGRKTSDGHPVDTAPILG